MAAEVWRGHRYRGAAARAGPGAGHNVARFMPRPSPAGHRHKTAKVRLTCDEHRAFDAAAASVGLSFSAWMRSAAYRQFDAEAAAWEAARATDAEAS